MKRKTIEEITQIVSAPIASKEQERDVYERLCREVAECICPNGGRCACLGGCLGNGLAMLRRASDHMYAADWGWWSDQGHCVLKIRAHDPDRSGYSLNAKNYYGPEDG